MNNARAGFTLIEVTIAMALLVLTFGGFMTILLLSQDVKQTVRYDLIAQNLAKEGLELVRYKRDKNYDDAYPGSADAFNEISNYQDNVPYSFVIDPSLTITAAVAKTTAMTAPPLTIFQSEYGYNSDSNAVTTVFRRLVTTTYYPSAVPPSLKVKVEVYWETDTKRKIVTVEEELTDWHF